MYAFNGYIAFMTRAPSGLTIEGAVSAEELSDALVSIKDEKLRNAPLTIGGFIFSAPGDRRRI